jgi:probable HAF family extracellular repeat protein
VRAFKWENGVMTDLGTLGGDNSSAAGINELGHIVGWAEDSRGSRRACVWINGQISDLNSRLLATQGGGTQLQEARDINDHGQIVGWARGTSGTEQIETAFALRIASQAEIDEANAIVAGQQTSSDDSDGVDNGVPGGTSTSGAGTGVQVDGTPQNLDETEGGGDGAVDGGGVAGPAGLCGTGLASRAPFMLVGLAAVRFARRR